MNLTLFVLLIIVLLLIAIAIYDMHVIKVVTYQIQTNKISKNLKLVFLSDLHNQKFGKNNDRLIKKIDRYQPDYILIGGDMLTARPNKKNKEAIFLINQLSEKFQVYHALGNHEYRAKIYTETYGNMYNEYITSIKNAKMHILDNQSLFLQDENIRISGLSIDKMYYKRKNKSANAINELDISKSLGDSDFHTYQILLAHNPDYFENYKKWNPDLILSGHFHGGIIRIPGVGGLISASLQFFPKYDGGIYREKFGAFIISRGLGMHTIPIRIGNPCELVCIELSKNE